MKERHASRIDEGLRATSSAVIAPSLTKLGSNALFATHIDAYAVPDATTLNADLVEAIAAWQAADEGLVSSNQLGWHSSRDLLEREERAFRLIGYHFLQGLTESIRRYWRGFDPQEDKILWEAWANVNGRGAFNAPHNHSDFHLSGVYYVATPETSGRSGVIEFLNPGGAVSSFLPFGKLLTRPQHRIAPKAGQLLVFPSFLRHWVYPNQDDAVRISIAFNALVTAQKLR